jgi:hypothetical protein
MLSDRQYRLLTGLVDGQLPPAQHQQAQELLRQLPAARALLEKLQADSDLLAALPHAQLAEGFTAQLQAALPPRTLQLARPPATPARRFSWRAAGVYAAAASLLLALGIAYMEKGGRPAGVVAPGPGGLVGPGSDIVATPPEQGELLPFPGPDTKLVTSIPPPAATRPEAPRSKPSPNLDSFHTAPVANIPRLRANEHRVPIMLAMRELEQEKHQKEISDELTLAPSWRFDLHCVESEIATNRLKKAFQQVGIRLLIEPDAGDRQHLRLPNTTYAVLAENLSPAECLAVLSGLRQVDRQELARSRSRNQFVDLKLAQLSKADAGRLPFLFGIASLAPEVSPGRREISTDLKSRDRDVLARARALAIWSGQLPDAGQGAVRTAFLVADAKTANHKSSTESQQFLNARQQPKPGLLQCLIVLTPRKG